MTPAPYPPGYIQYPDGEIARPLVTGKDTKQPGDQCRGKDESLFWQAVTLEDLKRPFRPWLDYRRPLSGATETNLSGGESRSDSASSGVIGIGTRTEGATDSVTNSPPAQTPPVASQPGEWRASNGIVWESTGVGWQLYHAPCAAALAEAHNDDIRILNADLAALRADKDQGKQAVIDCMSLYNDKHDECAALRAEIGEAKLRAVIVDPDDVPGEFERIGDWYHSETGFLRPGKSEPMATGRDSNSPENVRRFADWFDGKKREALHPTPAPEQAERRVT